ncbi:DUF1772 domain-containing protein [Nocardia pseudobrasiliensis]|uniref:DUF1772 domain-containing protein n=1 Tax=Nocardia pseudobrasiliensis TaxID=45979 RepID=A0A370HX91_9NOCA|nr:DUF1772 domain-containing protein [Nocardia pseudobrasiliensis]RDI63127.1 hypothetical protein DFR76_111145 [Nocardia pseudobrasiliensis]
MFTTAAQVLAVLAVLGNGIIYGTDACAGLIMRSVYKRLDDATVTVSAGWGHYYGDRRMPFAGAGGAITAVLALVAALIAGQAGAAVALGVTVLALITWMAFYLRVAKPINTAQTEAARTGVIPPNARALQDKWDSILGYRIGLQATAIAGLCVGLALL